MGYMTNSSTQEWRGCMIAARSATYHHAAYDFAARTLCGLETQQLAEIGTPRPAGLCPRCAQAYQLEQAAEQGRADVTAGADPFAGILGAHGLDGCTCGSRTASHRASCPWVM